MDSNFARSADSALSLRAERRVPPNSVVASAMQEGVCDTPLPIEILLRKKLRHQLRRVPRFLHLRAVPGSGHYCRVDLERQRAIVIFPATDVRTYPSAVSASVRSLNYVVPIHAEEEMDEDGLVVFDLENVVQTGEIIECQPDRVTRECYGAARNNHCL